MKNVRPEFTEEEYTKIKQEADALGVSLKQFVRDRALGIVTEDTPLCSTKLLCDEMAKCREVLNQIIRKEIESGIGLYEDDIIRTEMTMAELEERVTAFTRTKLREAKHHG